MGIPVRLLLVEDSEDDATLLLHHLRLGGYQLESVRVATEPMLREKLAEKNWDVVISDYNMPAFTGLDALAVVKEIAADTPFILMSGTIGEDVAVQAMKAGASDYIMKDKPARLVPALKRELSDSARRHQDRLTLKKKEEELRQAQKMEVIGQIAGGLAHDFNNILGVISLYAEKIVASTQDPNGLKEGVDGILQAQDRGAKLIRQLLTLSRKQKYAEEIFGLNSTIKGMTDILTIALGTKNEIILELDPKPLEIFGDSTQIEQVLMNLVVNARDALPEGGPVKIQTRAISGKKGDFAQLVVADSGIGMDKTTLQRAFEPFFTTKEIGKGSGLGLATVLTIVKQHGGDISITSQLGKGTTFCITLPLCKPKNPLEFP